MKNLYIDRYNQFIDEGDYYIFAFINVLSEIKEERKNSLPLLSPLFINLYKNTVIIDLLIAQVKENPLNIEKYIGAYTKCCLDKEINEFLNYFKEFYKNYFTSLLEECSAEDPGFNKFPNERCIPPGPYFIENLLLDKKLDGRIFSSDKFSLNNSIQRHASWIFNKIYCVPYIQDVHFNKDIARYVHGIQHTARAAMYIPMLANLYRRYGDTEALALNDRQLKLIQITTLFHDSAREGENEDLWDHESAIFLYQYLTQTLSLDPAEAKIFSEAVANKDSYHDYYELVDNKDGSFLWKKCLPRPRNIYQKLLHDADSIDIARVKYFGVRYLDFMDIAKNNRMAFEEISKLTKVEINNILLTQGDLRIDSSPEKKINYENKNAYDNILGSIDKKEHPILHTLYANGKLLSKYQLDSIPPLVNRGLPNLSEEITQANLQAYSNHGLLFARIISAPSQPTIEKGEFVELRADKEFRKTARRGKKVCNPNRSTSMVMVEAGSMLIGNAGLFIINPLISSIKKIDELDSDSGQGKKVLTLETKRTPKKQRAELIKLGIKLQTKDNVKRICQYDTTHNEVIFDLTEYHAICYTTEQTFANYEHYKILLQPHTSLLEAIFIQNSYQNKHLKKLPIFEYSGTNNFIKKRNDPDDEELLNIWKEICEDYLNKQFEENKINTKIFSMSLNDIKNCCVYGSCRETKGSPDSNYRPDLQVQINKIIENLLQKKKELFLSKIKTKELSIFANEISPFLIQSPKLLAEMKENIKTDLQQIITAYDKNHHEFVVQEYERMRINYVTTGKEMLSCCFHTEDNWVKAYFYALTIDDSDLINAIHNKSTLLINKAIDNIIALIDSDPEYFLYAAISLGQLRQISCCLDVLPQFDSKVNAFCESIEKRILENNDLKQYEPDKIFNFISILNEIGLLDRFNAFGESIEKRMLENNGLKQYEPDKISTPPPSSSPELTVTTLPFRTRL